MQVIRVEGRIQEDAHANEQTKTQKGRQKEELCPVVAILCMCPVPPPSFCERRLSSFSV